MAFVIIAAVARNYVIGDRGQIPWFSDDEIRKPDMKKFRELTLGTSVIMGRSTFDSLKKPLEDRTNIVLTRNPDYIAPNGVISAKSIEEALDISKFSKRDVYIIGGAQVYKQTIGLADRLELTELNTDYSGDVLFPEYRNTGEWNRVKVEHRKKFSFVTYERT
ncbi:MAG: dihydrofolate reductase [Nanoarchaeota archaeon]|mgnify:FL=1